MVPGKQKWDKGKGNHPIIYIFHRGLQFMVQGIGNEFQSCLAPGLRGQPQPTICAWRVSWGGQLSAWQEVLLCQPLLRMVSWQCAWQVSAPALAEGCLSRWLTGSGYCSPRRLPRLVLPSINVRSCITHRIILNPPKREAKKSKIFHSVFWNRLLSVRVKHTTHTHTHTHTHTQGEKTHQFLQMERWSPFRKVEFLWNGGILGKKKT